MSLIINNSPDITLLSVRVTFDLSGVTPVVELENLSQGNNLAGVSYAWTIISPDTSYITQGDINSPQQTGIWSSAIDANPWPRPFNQITWSGAPFRFFIVAKDSNGNIFTAPTQYASICRPFGNTPQSKNFYGVGIVDVKVQCDDAYIFFQEMSNTTYKGLTGQIGSSVLKVTFPMDATGTQPAPFEINNFSTALVPISFSAAGYQFYYSSTYDYDFGNDVHVILRYVLIDTFPVYCNIDLCPLVCEIEKMIQTIESGRCADADKANADLLLINSKLNLVMIGIKEPLCGIDVPGLIEQIKAIGGFDCNCCNTATGIVRQTSSVIGGYNFIINSICGDISGEVETNGNNISFNLQDKKYVFKICESSPPETTAFTVEKSEDGEQCQVTYCLNVDMDQLAEDMATTIANNSSLLNLWRLLFQNNAGDFDLIVDGNCIFSSSATCDYSILLTGIPANTTFALITSITIGGVPHALNYAFNLTNLAGLQTYLNTLGYGTFSVSEVEGAVVITSNTNANNIQQLTYKISATSYLGDISKNCTGFVPISANEVIQNIINYLCGLTDSQVVTSQDYQICWINPATGQKVITTISGNTALSTFLSALVEKGCSTIDYIISLNKLNCAAINAIFPVSEQPFQANDYFYGVKAGVCARISPSDAGNTILNLILTNPTLLETLCQSVIACGGGLPCAPYNELSASLEPFDAECPAIIGFNYFFSGSTFNLTKIIFANTPSGAQTITFEYKLASAGSYTVASGTVAVNADGTINTPPTVVFTPGATYDIRLSNNCDSPPNYFVDEVVTPGSVQSGQFKLNNDSSDTGICVDESVYTLYSLNPYAPGAFMYYDSDLTLPVTGFDFIQSTGSNDVYNLDSGTGEVDALERSCGVILGEYALSNNLGTICSDVHSFLYSAEPFGPTVTMYTDAALTIPAVGFDYIWQAPTGFIYNMNSITGIVQASTGNAC